MRGKKIKSPQFLWAYLWRTGGVEPLTSFPMHIGTANATFDPLWRTGESNP